MSFTSIIKNEISKLETNTLENIAELSCIVANSIIEDNHIKIITENASVARRIFNLFKKIFLISPIISVRKLNNKKYSYILEIKKEIKNITENLLLVKTPFKNEILTTEEEVKAYLRGLFLTTGSINDPKTSRYHLEFVVEEEIYASDMCNLLNQYFLNSKYIKRENKYMIYVKEAEKIGDFLRIIEAYNAVMYYEDIRIYRDHKNMTNRLNNCEQANVDKIIKTAEEQVNDIKKLQSQNRFLSLKPKEQEVALYRLKYVEASLQELSEIISYETGKEITKSGLYHRFKKIKEIADKF